VKREGKKKSAADATALPEKAMKDILARLRQQGATIVKRIDVSNIVVDERVRLKCQIPICDNYGKNLTCPPYVPSVAVFREALARYTDAILIQITTPLPEAMSSSPSAEIYAPAKKLHELVNLAEKWAFEYHFYFATGLIGGCCRLCDECVAVNNGHICRHPFKARPSMEAMGIDVVETVIRSGLSTGMINTKLRFPITNEVVWTGVVLV
jgi:predicted metal-binding protein